MPARSRSRQERRCLEDLGSATVIRDLFSIRMDATDAVLRRAVKVLINFILSAVGRKWNAKIQIGPIFRETRKGGS